MFLFTFTSFGVILILGGPRFATLETEIYRQTAQLLNLPLAAALTLVQLVAVVVLLLVTGRIEGRRTRRAAAALGAARPPTARAPPPRTRPSSEPTSRVMALAARRARCSCSSSGRCTRPAATASTSTARSATLHAGSTLFVPPIEAIANSLRFAVIATVLAVVVGGCAAFALAAAPQCAALDAVVSLPLGVSAVTVGFGFLIALDQPPLDLRDVVVLIPIAQALVALPFVVRIVTPVLRAIDHRLREAAATLGASPARVWREVDLPIVARAALSWRPASRSRSRSASSAPRSSSPGPTRRRCPSRSTGCSAARAR